MGRAVCAWLKVIKRLVVTVLYYARFLVQTGPLFRRLASSVSAFYNIELFLIHMLSTVKCNYRILLTSYFRPVLAFCGPRVPIGPER